MCYGMLKTAARAKQEFRHNSDMSKKQIHIDYGARYPKWFRYPIYQIEHGDGPIGRQLTWSGEPLEIGDLEAEPFRCLCREAFLSVKTEAQLLDYVGSYGLPYTTEFGTGALGIPFEKVFDMLGIASSLCWLDSLIDAIKDDDVSGFIASDVREVATVELILVGPETIQEIRRGQTETRMNDFYFLSSESKSDGPSRLCSRAPASEKALLVSAAAWSRQRKKISKEFACKEVARLLELLVSGIRLSVSIAPDRSSLSEELKAFTPFDTVALHLYQKAIGKVNLKRCAHPSCRKVILTGRSDARVCDRPGCGKWATRNLGPVRKYTKGGS